MRFFIIAFFLLSVFSANAAEVAIRVRAHSLVQGKTLTLGDIADFSGFNAGETLSLKKIALGNAPAFGEKRKYTNQALTEILRVHLNEVRGDSARRIKLQVPEEISVEGNGTVLTPDLLRAGLLENLKKVCDVCEYKIEDLKVPEISALSPQSTWSIRADFHKLKGPFNLPLEVVSLTGEKNVHWLTGRLSIWKKVPVSTRLLAIQDRIIETDFKWISREITFLSDTTPIEAELVGAQIKSSVSPDQVILQSHLVRKHALDRGQVVTVTTGTEAWSLTLKGVAQDSGYLGDTVRVLNPETRKIVMGTVTAHGTVEIQ